MTVRGDPGRMFAIRGVVFALAVGGAMVPAHAQQPAPAGEVETAVWSADEVATLHYMQRILEQGCKAPGRMVWLHDGGSTKGGCRIKCFRRGEDGTCEETTSADPAQGLFLLAWPIPQHRFARRGILIHSDGTTLCCNVEKGDAQQVTPELALARGGAGLFGDALRQPGSSESGHFWLWLEQIQQSATVELVDEDGRPRAGLEVSFVSPTPRLPVDVRLPRGAWPAATGVVDQEGQARMRGPRVRGLGVLIEVPWQARILRGFTVETTPTGLRIVLTNEAIRRATIGLEELAAITTLKGLGQAQAQCQASGIIDADSNGQGEYGYFGELTGSTVVRGSPTLRIGPPILPQDFARLTNSRVERGGYLFQLWLPGKDGVPVAEAPTGGGKDAQGKDLEIDPALAELNWCAYAWPASFARGQRAFFLSISGYVLAYDNENRTYVGHNWAPAPNAAFSPGVTSLSARSIAINGKGADGHVWRVQQ